MTTDKKQIPQFHSREEEVRFWDTHSAADYWDTMTPSKVHFSKYLSSEISIRVAPEEIEKLRSEAKHEGVGPTTLARRWILEHLSAI